MLLIDKSVRHACSIANVAKDVKPQMGYDFTNWRWSWGRNDSGGPICVLMREVQTEPAATPGISYTHAECMCKFA